MTEPNPAPTHVVLTFPSFSEFPPGVEDPVAQLLTHTANADIGCAIAGVFGISPKLLAHRPDALPLGRVQSVKCGEGNLAGSVAVTVKLSEAGLAFVDEVQSSAEWRARHGLGDLGAVVTEHTPPGASPEKP